MSAIALRELRGLLRTPQGWVLLAVTQFVTAWWYLLLLDRYRSQYEPMLRKLESSQGVADLVVAPFLGGLPLLTVLLAATAVLGMRSFAEERRNATMPLLLAAPQRSAAIVAGKFLGSLAFLTLAVALWSALPMTLALGTGLDFGRLAAGILGLWLTGAALLAVATLCSTLTEQPGVAALLGFGAGLALLLIGQGQGEGILQYLGLTGHYQVFLEGTVAIADLAFFALLVLASLVTAAWRVQRLREA
jgi:ABC-2 type transport system permease protein